MRIWGTEPSSVIIRIFLCWYGFAYSVMIFRNKNGIEFIGVLRHMQRYFSHICDDTDVQADWRSCTYGRAPNAIEIS